MSTREGIDLGFYTRAVDVLQQQELTACEFMRRHPNCSKKSLAAVLGNGVTSRGLTMKLFEEAHNNSQLDWLVKELLYRKILNEFPTGWREDDKVRATVRIGSWYSDISEFAPDYRECAAEIIRALSATERPHIGWIPKSSEDDVIQTLFQAHWNK